MSLQRLWLLAAEAHEQGAGRVADVGAVEIEPDTLHQMADLCLGKAGVTACETTLDASKTGLCGACELGNKCRRMGVRTGERFKVSHGVLRSGVGWRCGTNDVRAIWFPPSKMNAAECYLVSPSDHIVRRSVDRCRRN